MAELESNVAISTPSARGTVRSARRSKFYVVLAAVLLALILIGFWPSYYGPLVSGTAEAPLLLHVHGAIYIGWMLLLIVQTALAAQGKIRTHRAVGNFGIGYGALVWVLGMLVSFAAPVMTLNAGTRTLDEAAGFMLIPLGDMVLFGGFFLAAVVYRTKPEIHKRLMILATIAIVFAAAFRMQALGVPIQATVALWFALPIACMVYDFRSRGQVHPVYWIGLAAMVVAILRLPFSETGAWLAVGRPIVESLA